MQYFRGVKPSLTFSVKYYNFTLGTLFQKTPKRRNPMPFLVIAYYRSRHGDTATPVLLTDDFVKAVEVARTLDQREFGFNGIDHGVGIYQLELERRYLKNDFSFYGDVAWNGHPAIYFRRMTREGWKEEWYQDEFEKMLSGEPSLSEGRREFVEWAKRSGSSLPPLGSEEFEEQYSNWRSVGMLRDPAG